MKVQAIEDASNELLQKMSTKQGPAKLFLIKLDINKKNNRFQSDTILGTIVGENLPENLYQTITDAINRENAIVTERNKLRELATFQETVFVEDIDHNTQETYLTDNLDYNKTDIALSTDDGVVTYANLEDVYEKVNKNTKDKNEDNNDEMKHKKEELLELKNILIKSASPSLKTINSYSSQSKESHEGRSK